MFQFQHPDPAQLMPVPVQHGLLAGTALSPGALFAAPAGQGNLPPGAQFAAGPAASPYPVDFHRSGLAVGYANEEYIADQLLPRIPVLVRREYRFNEYPIEEHFTVPPTLVGRRSAPAMVHLTSSEVTRSVDDYGLDDAIPADDVQNTPATAMNPIDRSSMVLTDLLMISQELRVARMTFDAAQYPASNKVTLSGTSQWNHADSNPLRDIVAQARLTLYAEPDAGVVLGVARAAIEDHIAARHRLGHDITRSGLFAALHQVGVQNVTLVRPAADLVIGPEGAAHCTGIGIELGGRDV